MKISELLVVSFLQNKWLQNDNSSTHRWCHAGYILFQNFIEDTVCMCVCVRHRLCCPQPDCSSWMRWRRRVVSSWALSSIRPTVWEYEPSPTCTPALSSSCRPTAMQVCVYKLKTIWTISLQIVLHPDYWIVSVSGSVLDAPLKSGCVCPGGCRAEEKQNGKRFN